VTIEIGYAARLALIACLIGLWRRGRLNECRSFLAYAAAIIVIGEITALWREQFFTYTWYLRSQAVYNVFKFAVALELGVRVFRAFPVALARLRLFTIAILGVTTYAVVASPFEVDLKRLFLDREPTIQAGVIWLMTSEMLLILWHRLPVTDFQKAILLGFVPYLLVFDTLMKVLRLLDVATGVPMEYMGVGNSTAYLSACAWWAWAAWRPSRDLGANTLFDEPRRAA
jgi:hypothetical protein